MIFVLWKFIQNWKKKVKMTIIGPPPHSMKQNRKKRLGPKWDQSSVKKVVSRKSGIFARSCAMKDYSSSLTHIVYK